MTPRSHKDQRLTVGDGTSVWAGYAEGTAGRPPTKFLEVALDRAGSKGLGRLAIDLGSGAGNETLALLDNGWRVLAVDGEPRAMEILESRVADRHVPRLETRIAQFANLDLPKADLVLASLSLPFAGEALPLVMEKALDAVVGGGWFIGVLFGVNDTWASEPDVAVVERAEIEAWLGSFTDVGIEEEEFDGSSGAGPKHWHWYVVSARRPGSRAMQGEET